MTDLLSGNALRTRAALALAVPLPTALGVALIDDADPSAGVELRVDGLATNGAGSAHAAALGAALELAAYLALLPALGEHEHAVTHAVATQLIRAAPEGATVRVRGELDRRTRRTAFVGVTATVADQVVARSQVTKTIVPLGVVT